MNKKFGIFFVICLVLCLSINHTYSEETASNANPSDTANSQTTQPQKPPGPEDSDVQSKKAEENKQENTKKSKSQSKKKKAEKKVEEKVENEKENEKENENTDLKKSTSETPPTAPNTENKSGVSLPDLSDDKVPNSFGNSDISGSSVNPVGERLIKGIVSWILMLTGVVLIIWVIFSNRKIPKEKTIKIKRKKHLYYKNSRRK